ncbi:MAG: hypothetical protein F4W95_10030 [Chloroflexi bacterium]|nr:hypothetical protein [Chloroflexota bacterium]MYD48809.1 hypothetical protein [Chloroflexota bacterium]
MINRMAENSRSCKVWCVTLVAATLVLVARTAEPQHALIALVPTLLFLFLDSYYLALERAFIRSQNAFVGRLHQSELESADLYRVVPSGMGLPLIMRCLLGSVSIWPFYLLVTVTILLTWLLIIPSDTPLTKGGL